MKKHGFFVVILFAVSVLAFAQTENDFEVSLTADYTGALITRYKGSGISAIRIPETLQGFPVKEIGNGVFYDNRTITSVTLPSTIEKIGSSAFHDCQNLSVVNIPANVLRIEFGRAIEQNYRGSRWTEYSFSGCNLLFSSQSALKLRGYNGDFSSKRIGNYRVTLTEDYTGLRIVNAAFDLVYALTVRDGQRNLSFYERATIPNVVIPTNFEGMIVKEIGSSSFIYSQSLNSQNDQRVVVNDTSNIPTAVPHITNSVTIPEGVVIIMERAFSSQLLRSVVLPSTLRIIGNSAFSGCRQLSNVRLPSGITEIGSSAFSNCSSFTSIDLPSTVKKIGANAFSGCSNLTNITVPDTIEVIESGAFSGTKLPLPIQAELRRLGYTGSF